MIKKHLITFILFCFGATTARAQIPPLDSTHSPYNIYFSGFAGDTAAALSGLRSEIAAILPNTKYKRMTPSCKIVFYEPDNTLHNIYALSPNVPVLPASVEKLFTTSATLWALGSEYMFTTKLDLAPPARVEGNSVIGNIYLRPSGDPTLRVQDFDQLAAGLRTYNITQIEGDIISDESEDDILTPDAKKYFADHTGLPSVSAGDSLLPEVIISADSSATDEESDVTNDQADEEAEPGFL
ncbi:MAG: D-alanyl-D-alanine carboxypeptidase, partial [Ignavibacteriota bacterium]